MKQKLTNLLILLIELTLIMGSFWTGGIFVGLSIFTVFLMLEGIVIYLNQIFSETNKNINSVKILFTEEIKKIFTESMKNAPDFFVNRIPENKSLEEIYNEIEFSEEPISIQESFLSQAIQQGDIGAVIMLLKSRCLNKNINWADLPTEMITPLISKLLKGMEEGKKKFEREFRSGESSDWIPQSLDIQS